MRAPNHLNALRAFEAAALHLSYVAAAEQTNSMWRPRPWESVARATHGQRHRAASICRQVAVAVAARWALCDEI